MATILFATWDGGGNLPPTLAVARELADRGHKVAFLAHPDQQEAIRGVGLAFDRYPTADVRRRELALFADRGHGDDVLRWTQRNHPDLVVVDCFLFGVMDTLRDAGREYVVFEHLFDGYLRSAVRGPLGLALRLKGVRPKQALAKATLTVTAALESLDAGHGSVLHVGPAVSGVPAGATTPPTVLISLSTYPFKSLLPTWQRLLDAVDGMPVRIVATLGPHADPEALSIPAGVEVHRWLPHEQVMPAASLVITHGGHGTAMTALAHDLPLLVMPLDPRADQRTVGRAAQSSGAGRMLSPRATTKRIRATIEELLAPGAHRDAAARIGAELRGIDGRTAGADALEAELNALRGRAAR